MLKDIYLLTFCIFLSAIKRVNPHNQLKIKIKLNLSTKSSYVYVLLDTLSKLVQNKFI